MKALLCAKCVDIRALHPEGEWTTCRCGNTSARWVDPNRGTVVVNAIDRDKVRILGMNNQMLTAGLMAGGHDNECWQHLHEIATDAKGFIFDKSMRGCWACILRVGETGDIAWAKPEDI